MSGLLDGPRARGAFLLRSSFDPPWSLSVQDEAPLTLVAVVTGEAWLAQDSRPGVLLGPGDIAVLRGSGHYRLADSLTTEPQAVILPGQVCITPQGKELEAMTVQGVRFWGNSPDGATVMLTGTYQEVAAVSQRLLGALPDLVVLERRAWDTPLVDLLAQEVARDESGQEAVLDRLLDLLLIAALRVWATGASSAPGWHAAAGDPVVGPALRLLQDAPERPWTVQSVAREVGMSRAGLSRRFTALVGEPPMSYLTGWRLALAADLLREPGLTLETVARRVGYGSAFALSAAFKRERGVSPAQHRALVRA